MTNNVKRLGGISGIIGVILLVVSFNINPGPPQDASYEQLLSFGHQYYASILWGAWLQTIGPFLIILFAFSLVFISGAAQTLAGWMVFFGAGILMTISLIEITFYIAVLFKDPPQGSLIRIEYYLRRSASLFHHRRSGTVYSSGNCIAKIKHPAQMVRLAGYRNRRLLRNPRDRFSSSFDPARLGYGHRRSSGNMVAGFFDHDFSPVQNR